MKILNFSHPLSSEQLAQVSELLPGQTFSVIQVKCQLDHCRSFIDQVKLLIDCVGWTPTQWQQVPFMVNIPGHAAASACVLAEIHGRAGYFPTILRLAPIPGVVPPQFAVAEIVSLQHVREEARTRR